MHGTVLMHNMMIMSCNVQYNVVYNIYVSVAPDVQTSAIYYFLIALVILLIAFDSNFLLPHLVLPSGSRVVCLF